MPDADRQARLRQVPGSLCLDFPLRPDFMAQVVVPKDMTSAEAKRLRGFLLSLAVPTTGGDER